MGDNKGLKKNVMVTLDNEMLKQAKAAFLNISEAAEEGIMKKLNRQEIDLAATYPPELAELEPDTYWIKPADGLCHKRGTPQFFISKNNSVYPVSKQEYMRLKNYLYKKTSVITPKRPKASKDVVMAQACDIDSTPLK